MQADVPGVIADFMALWPDILTQYEAELEASRVAYQQRQRELEEARKPVWLKALAALSAQEQGATCPQLDERVVLPAALVCTVSPGGTT